MIQDHLAHAGVNRVPQFAGQLQLTVQNRFEFLYRIAVRIRDLVDQSQIVTLS